MVISGLVNARSLIQILLKQMVRRFCTKRIEEVVKICTCYCDSYLYSYVLCFLMPSQPRQVMVKTTELQVNQDYENLLPPLLDEDLENLEKSVLEEGILHSLIINPDKVVLDGHHRLMICRRHSINEVPVIERSFDSELEEMEFVISFNLTRRHLTMTQKVELAITIFKIETVKAKQRQLSTLPKKGTKGFANVPPNSEGHSEEPGEATEIAAKKVGP